MLRLLALPVCLAFSLAGASHAQETGPMTQLQSAARSSGCGAQAFDGSVQRRDGDLEILSERKGALIKAEYVPTHQVLGADNFCCFTVPAEMVRTYGDIQTVRIHDRKQYEEHAKQNGAAIGLAIGALGFLALLATPWGMFIGMATLFLAGHIGAKIAESKAAQDPTVFERVVNEYRIPSKP